MSQSNTKRLLFPIEIVEKYPDILNDEALITLDKLAVLNGERIALMEKRSSRRKQRFAEHERITFLKSDAIIGGSTTSVADARAGKFSGPKIPQDLQRQWIQGTGPAAKPEAPLESSIRNVAYALLSGADGWMFDGEDALGQINTMSLDNLRNLKLAYQQGSDIP